VIMKYEDFYKKWAFRDTYPLELRENAYHIAHWEKVSPKIEVSKSVKKYVDYLRQDVLMDIWHIPRNDCFHPKVLREWRKDCKAARVRPMKGTKLTYYEITDYLFPTDTQSE